jgi:hypothetical protein
MESTEIFSKSSGLLHLNSIRGVRKKDIGKAPTAVQEDDIRCSTCHFPREGCRRKDLYSKIKDSSANSSPGKIVSKSRCEHLSTNKSRPSLNPESRMNEMSIVLINSIHANAAEVETRRSFTSLNQISYSYVPNKLVPNGINRN